MKVSIDVSSETVYNLLSCAFEGGVGYWCRLDNYTLNDERVYGYEHLADPDGDACWVISEIDEWEADDSKWDTHTVTYEKLLEGLHVMAAKYPWHFANIFNGNMDSETGDVFLQCSLLGEIVYG